MRIPQICLALFALSAALCPAAKKEIFHDPHDYQIFSNGLQPYTADLNGDGIPDIVVASSGGIVVLLGRPDGQFAAAARVSGNLTPSLAIADFNGDGKLDIVASIVTNGSSLVFLAGNGDGTFQPAQPLANPCLDCFLATADFNGDGKADLAVAGTNSFNVLLGAGNGTFQAAPASYPLTFGTYVTTGDVNGDNIPDAVVVDFGAAVADVFIGKGDGTFELTSYPGGNGQFQAVLADLNHDGKPDLITQDRDSALITVRLNQGLGVFQASGTNYDSGCTPTLGCTFEGIAAGDFNHDGHVDIATPRTVLYGNGDGTLQPKSPFLAGNYPINLAAADLNGDGVSDLVVANTATNISVLFGSPKGVVQAPELLTGLRPVTAVSADFNGDGIADLAVGSVAQHKVLIFLGTGGGKFSEGVSIATSNPGGLVAGDFNRDGKMDLAATSQDNGATIFLGNGDGTFTRGANYPALYGDCTNHAFAGITPSPCFAAADLNGDGNLDLIGANWIQPLAIVYFGNGDGTFRAGPTFVPSGTPTGLAVADLNHDGIPDLAFSLFFTGAVVYQGVGDGSFINPVTIPVPNNTPAAIAIGDVTGDGNPDLVVAGGGSSGVLSLNVFVLPGNGNFTFGPTVNLLADAQPNGIALADLNGDGILDVASANYSAADVSVFLSKGGGAFESFPPFISGAGPCGIIAAGIDGTGFPDLISINQSSNSLTLFLHSQH